jgi:hypothetical protein
VHQPPPLHSSRREYIARARRKAAEPEVTPFRVILGIAVLSTFGLLWFIVGAAAVVLSALGVYGLWDLGRILLGG